MPPDHCAIEIISSDEETLPITSINSITLPPKNEIKELKIDENEHFLLPYTADQVDEETFEFPSIHELFLLYNDQYFWGELASVEVKWSKRMTLCAGICSYHKGGLCSIRLSEPILKFRTLDNLKETLLHEMIHAYLFLTEKNRDHWGHGASFVLHMRRINAKTSLNITIYHNFHDEVNEHKRHIWRCDGPCRNVPPFFGFVFRAANRKPSSNDYWWEEHTRMCSGSFQKFLEPPQKEKTLDIGVAALTIFSVEKEIVMGPMKKFLSSDKEKVKEEPVQATEKEIVCPICTHPHKEKIMHHHLPNCIKERNQIIKALLKEGKK